jgi:riboflavin kinase / FMN adenylyltransferase
MKSCLVKNNFLEYTDLNLEKHNLVLAIGMFDGVHLGHKKIIKEARCLADKLNSKMAILTFFNHPKQIFNNDKIKLILTNKEKIEILKNFEFNIDNIVFLPFNERFSKINPKVFMNMLFQFFDLKGIVVGQDFCFGSGREGNTEFIKSFLKENNKNISFKVVDILCKNGEKISSTIIKKNLLDGNLKQVKEFLGHDFFVMGKVVKGFQIARKYGYPTANVWTKKNKIIPEGVFLGKIEYKNLFYYGIISVGKRETLDKNLMLSLEVHIFDFSSDIYGENLKVYFLEKIRDQKKFNSLSDLFSQVEKDINIAKEILKKRIF